MRNILILDDDIGLLNVVEAILAHNRFKVFLSHPQEDIYSLIKLYQPDLIILEYLMDDINGGELCRKVKNNPNTKHIPVIIFTAYEKVIYSLGNYGCDAIISKPIDFKIFLSSIYQLLNVPIKAV